MPQHVALLQALDKVSNRVSMLTVKVGGVARFGHLSIAVQACMTHPPDQPEDAAAFLQIRDPRPDAPGFTGWILAEEPWVSMLQSPVYDIRVVGCR